MDLCQIGVSIDNLNDKMENVTIDPCNGISNVQSTKEIPLPRDTQGKTSNQGMISIKDVVMDKIQVPMIEYLHTPGILENILSWEEKLIPQLDNEVNLK